MRGLRVVDQMIEGQYIEGAKFNMGISIYQPFPIFHKFLLIFRRSFAGFGALTRIFTIYTDDNKNQAMSEPTDNLDLGNGPGGAEYPPKGSPNKARESLTDS